MYLAGVGGAGPSFGYPQGEKAKRTVEEKGAIDLFLSSFTNKVDKKGRVSVPASFRQVVVGSRHPGVICYPSFVVDAIEGGAYERLSKLANAIDDLDPFSETRDAFSVSVMADVQVLSFDGDGRIMLPELLIDHAGLTDKAVFVGQGHKFEIWNPDRYAAYRAEARAIAKAERGNLKWGRRSPFAPSDSGEGGND